MINPQLLDYVRAQRASGLSKEAITQALAQGGWTAQDVSEAFMAIDGVQTPPPPPPAAPAAPAAPTMQAAAPVTAASVSTSPAPAGPRVITPPPGAAQPGVPPLQPLGSQFGNMTTTPVQPRPVMAASEMSTARVAQKKGHGLMWAIVLIVLLLIAGGAAFAYFQFGTVMSLLGMSLPEATPSYEETNPEVPEPGDTQPIEILPTETASTTASTTVSVTASTTASTTAGTASTTAH
ncbi:MAG TPA: hypothetical protein VHD37_03285 [Candidatus Paceibacterota bacterium]|nr:hypothetical protein [Candidatus Paceibacterota bacterium]